LYTGYYIQDQYIYGPKRTGRYWIQDGYIYGPGSNGRYYLSDNYVYGPGSQGRFYIQDGYIYGPSRDVPWLPDEDWFYKARLAWSARACESSVRRYSCGRARRTPCPILLKGGVASMRCNDGLDGRCRDEDGEIRKKRDDTLVRTLRRTYGEDFADEFRSDATLGTVLRETGSESLSDYLKHRR